MRVRLTKTARAARNHLLATRLDDPDALVALLQQFDEAAHRLARFPYLGRVGTVAGTRELVLSGTPYLLVYRIDETKVLILDIRHSSRKD